MFIKLDKEKGDENSLQFKRRDLNENVYQLIRNHVEVAKSKIFNLASPEDAFDHFNEVLR